LTNPFRSQPLVKHDILKKKRGKVARWHSDRYMRLSRTSWRQPRGIDSRFRRRFKGSGPHPNIGFGSNNKTKNLLPNGFYKFVINNTSDLELLLMHNRSYCAEIAHNVSTRNRRSILERAEQLNVRVTNGKAGFRKEEQ
jgi:large subunit ribosomal protein L32e